MPFMEPQIVEDDWIVTDSKHGGQVIPLDVLGTKGAAELQDIIKRIDAGDDDAKDEATALLDDYLEPGTTRLDDVVIEHAFGFRFSAPGYMDASEWELFDTEAEAVEHAREECFDEGYCYDCECEIGDDDGCTCSPPCSECEKNEVLSTPPYFANPTPGTSASNMSLLTRACRETGRAHADSAPAS